MEGTEMPYVSFGHGARSLVLLPGLSDGLETVEGKALLLAKPYTLFFERWTVYLFSRKTSCPRARRSGIWRRTRQRPCARSGSAGLT